VIVTLICGKCGAELGKIFEHPPGAKTATAKGLCMRCWNQLERMECQVTTQRKRA
jgi:hypothetical protein